MTLRAVTIDAYGTLVMLRDPVPALQAALADRGIVRDAGEVRRAFELEAAFYTARSHEGRDDATLALLRKKCARVFLDAARAKLDPDAFAPAFVSSLTFEELPGARAACQTLGDAGLRLAVVSNWDIGLREHRSPRDRRARGRDRHVRRGRCAKTGAGGVRARTRPPRRRCGAGCACRRRRLG